MEVLWPKLTPFVWTKELKHRTLCACSCLPLAKVIRKDLPRKGKERGSEVSHLSFAALSISLIQPYLLYGIIAWAEPPKHIETKSFFFKNVPTAWCTLEIINLTLYPTFFLLVFFLLIFCICTYFKSVAVLMHDISNYVFHKQTTPR